MEAGSEQRPPRRGLGARLAGALGRRAPVRPQPPQPETAEEEPATAAEAEWLESAVQEFERRLADALMQAGDDLYAQVERDLAATEERLSASERRLEDNLAERLEGAVAEIRVQRDAQLADEIERVRETADAPLARIRKTEAEAIRSAEAAASRAEKSAGCTT